MDAKIYILFLSVFLIISSGGCIEGPPEGTNHRPSGVNIRAVVGEMPLNYSEVVLINATFVKPIFENKSYVFENGISKNESVESVLYWIYLPNIHDPYRHEFNFRIYKILYNNTTSAKLDFRRAPPSDSPNETYEINLLKQKTIEVAEICNLTLDWNKSKINVIYED
jgi:hypothetical protein